MQLHIDPDPQQNNNNRTPTEPSEADEMLAISQGLALRALKVADRARAEASVGGRDFKVTDPLDADGQPVTVGARVQQLNVYDPRYGAIYANANKLGTVKSLGRTRAEVQFDGATITKDFGHTVTDEPITHRVRTDLLRVIPDTPKEG